MTTVETMTTLKTRWWQKRLLWRRRGRLPGTWRGSRRKNGGHRYNEDAMTAMMVMKTTSTKSSTLTAGTAAPLHPILCCIVYFTRLLNSTHNGKANVLHDIYFQWEISGFLYLTNLIAILAASVYEAFWNHANEAQVLLARCSKKIKIKFCFLPLYFVMSLYGCFIILCSSKQSWAPKWMSFHRSPWLGTCIYMNSLS